MSNVVESAKQIILERAAKKASERSKAMAQSRRLAIAVVLENPSPDPNEIILVCDELNVGVDWFDGAIDACRRRIADVEGLGRIPVLTEQAETLEREAFLLTPQVDAMKSRNDLAFWDIKNQDSRTLAAYRKDLKAEEMADFRKLQFEHFEAMDRLWFMTSDAEILREEIAALKKIDRNNIDPRSSEPSPHDFKLPAIA